MIPAERAHLQTFAKSHPGKSGKPNEDRYAITAYRLSDENPLPVIFAIVADGIGGHRAGEVAAEIAVETISERVANSDASQPVRILREAIIHASQAIHDESESDPDKKGMGATCACCWIIEDRLYTATVGDSRIYLIRENKIRQLSKDHTWIQEAVEAGIIKPEQAQGHPNSHIIRRYLGSKQPTEPDTRLHLHQDESHEEAESNQGMRLIPGDKVIMCSDGLTDLVKASEILEMVKDQNQDKALDDLINIANQRGGHDNITIATICVPFSKEEAQPKAISNKQRQNFKAACLITSAAAILGIILIIAAILLIKNLLLPSASPTAVPTIFASPQIGIETQIGPSYTPETIQILPTKSPTNY